MTVTSVVPRLAPTHVSQDLFGEVNGQQVQRFTLNAGSVSVQLITLGAIITSIKVPDRHGAVEDIVLGYDTPAPYAALKNNRHFGAIIGRVANVIANSTFSLDGKVYKLNACCHGGTIGWNLAHWKATVLPDGVSFSHLSPDGDEKFPGAVRAMVTYRLTADGQLVVRMEATTTKATPINMVNHSYFNLAGHASGSKGLYRNRLLVNAGRYTPSDSGNVPTGEIKSTEGTQYDLRKPTLLGDLLPKFGLDNNFVISMKTSDKVVPVARLADSVSGRTLDISSNQPGIQVYTANGFSEYVSTIGSHVTYITYCGTKTPVIVGKGGAKYSKHCAVALETQNFPDAIHHPNFPNSVLRPGQKYEHHVVYKFGTVRN